MILTVITCDHNIKAMEELTNGTKKDGSPEEEDTRFSVNARQALSTSIFWRMWLSQVCLDLIQKNPGFDIMIFLDYLIRNLRLHWHICQELWTGLHI